jgi:hypothetical protein
MKGFPGNKYLEFIGVSVNLSSYTVEYLHIVNWIVVLLLVGVVRKITFGIPYLLP